MAAYLNAAAAAAVAQQSHRLMMTSPLPTSFHRAPISPLISSSCSPPGGFNHSPVEQPLQSPSAEGILDFSRRGQKSDAGDSDSDVVNLSKPETPPSAEPGNGPLDLSFSSRKRTSDEPLTQPPHRKPRTDYKPALPQWPPPIGPSHLPYFAAAVAAASLSPKNSSAELWNGKLKHITPTPSDATKALEKIELMKFDGEDLSLWPLFYENFKQFVHVKPEFSNAEKLQYLLGSLTGKALKTCNALEAIPDNYALIWKLLEDTYQDKRFLCSSYLDRLLNFRNIQINSPSNLQSFLEKFDTNVAALKRLKLTNLDDYILTHIALSKLPQETVNSFELIRGDNIPTYDELIKFIRQQSKIMVKPEKSRPSINYNSSSSSSRQSKTFVTNNNSNKKSCVACRGAFHLLIDCKKFKEITPDLRFKIIKDNNLCINCFSDKHRVSCCQSKYSCTICKFKHHTLLHRNISSTNTNQSNNNQDNNIESTPSTSQSLIHNYCTVNSEVNPHKENTVVLLSTAVVNVIDKWNKVQTIRFLVDSCSMSNILTIDCCRKLGLPYSKVFSNVIGIGGLSQPIKGKTNLIIQSSTDSKVKYNLEVLLANKITDKLPDVSVNLRQLSYLENLPLADPKYFVPGPIQGILGASIFAEILRNHTVVGPPNTPTAIETTLGYIVIGTAPTVPNNCNKQTFRTFFTLDPELDSLSPEISDLNDNVPLQSTAENEICEKLYLETYRRDSAGRYSVALPFKYDPINLGDSYSVAHKRLLLLENRLEKNPDLKITYHSILQDYLDQGHMSLVPDDQLNIPAYYIPHHCVFKPNSTSTPCRIVFDASARTIDHFVSLNDTLYTGPKLQQSLVHLLLNFRLHPIAVTSDIKQMYRMIQINEPHRRFQRILWRFDLNHPIATYELNTVTFGVKSSPYLSLRTLKQLVVDEGPYYPAAVDYVNHKMYMDDLVCSIPTLEEAINAYAQLTNLFQSGSFNMLKWSSNSTELLNNIPDNLKLLQPVEFQKNNLKVLGLLWDPPSDTFFFHINIELSECTKRNMLSLVARVFDPLSFLAPVTLYVKLLIKKLWELKLNWDDIAPTQIKNLWFKFHSELSMLNKIKIPRHVFVFSNTSVTLIGFCDACPAAIGCVIFIRSVQPDNSIKVSLLTAQSKVSPTRNVTLPRLELCAAALLSKLISQVKDTYLNNIEKIFALSDSMITLSWINSTPQKWNTFVANRVNQIQNRVPSSNWYFISGKGNVADSASRGLTPSALVSFKPWFSGPSWLLLPPCEWPIRPVNENIYQSNEEKRSICLVLKPEVSSLYSLIEYFSSWTKLLNATVFVLRFVKILPITNRISKTDLDKAELALVYAVQQKHFYIEYDRLVKNKNLKSNLRRLNPFIKDKIIRVGGRLTNANVSFNQKHPILLPKSDPFVDLLVDYNHKKYCHTGAYLLQSLLQQHYWILSARNLIRKRIWKCNHCFKLNPKPNYPMMSDLPVQRVNQAKAFLSTGVDYTGAFQITLGRRRGVKSQKAYVCLFICLVTKAIHLELAADLSTESFLAALKRFLSRRGNCSTIFSDCGTNFVGAKHVLNEIHKLVSSREYKDAFQQELNLHKIEWKFNVPSGPHFGGIWEANIKSVKSHLTKVVGLQILTYEEFLTVLTQIEALLNSRPLCYLSSDPNDPVALTPAHFLYSSPLNSLPAEDVSAEISNRLSRYKLLDAIVQQYWKRWHTEYLSTLQVRQKWNTDSNPPKIGMLVVIMQDNLPPLQWPLAIIQNLYPGKDGVARVAKVKTKNNSYLRPVAKLCPLPNQ